jgi:hypothetical protein
MCAPIILTSLWKKPHRRWGSRHWQTWARKLWESSALQRSVLFLEPLQKKSKANETEVRFLTSPAFWPWYKPLSLNLLFQSRNHETHGSGTLELNSSGRPQMICQVMSDYRRQRVHMIFTFILLPPSSWPLKKWFHTEQAELLILTLTSPRGTQPLCV